MVVENSKSVEGQLSFWILFSCLRYLIVLNHRPCADSPTLGLALFRLNIGILVWTCPMNAPLVILIADLVYQAYLVRIYRLPINIRHVFPQAGLLVGIDLYLLTYLSLIV